MSKSEGIFEEYEDLYKLTAKTADDHIEFYKKKKSIPETEFIANHFNSAYSKQLKERSKWLVEKFDSISDTQLAKLMNENIGKWGSEFTLSY